MGEGRAEASRPVVGGVRLRSLKRAPDVWVAARLRRLSGSKKPVVSGLRPVYGRLLCLADGLPDVTAGRTERKQRAGEQVERHGRVRGLHTGHAGLARAEEPGEPELREALAPPPLAQTLGERALDREQPGVALTERERFSGQRLEYMSDLT